MLDNEAEAEDVAEEQRDDREDYNQQDDDDDGHEDDVKMNVCQLSATCALEQQLQLLAGCGCGTLSLTHTHTHLDIHMQISNLFGATLERGHLQALMA